jgi:hypothetical protein
MGGVCYLETRDTDRFAAHWRPWLIDFIPSRLAFAIDRQRTAPSRSPTPGVREIKRIVHIIFGVKP